MLANGKVKSSSIEVLLYHRDWNNSHGKPTGHSGTGSGSRSFQSSRTGVNALHVDNLVEEWVRRVEEDMPEIKIVSYKEGYKFHRSRTLSLRERLRLFKGWVSTRVSEVKNEGFMGDQTLAKSAKAFHNDHFFKRLRRNVKQLFIEE